MRPIWLEKESSLYRSEPFVMPLRLKLDENMPRRVEAALQQLGIDVETASSEGLAGAADPVLLEACKTEDRVLVTLDLDFADMREYPPESHRGVWVLRPAQQTFDALLNLVHSGLRLAAIERTTGRLWIIGERQVRIRE